MSRYFLLAGVRDNRCTRAGLAVNAYRVRNAILRTRTGRAAPRHTGVGIRRYRIHACNPAGIRTVAKVRRRMGACGAGYLVLIGATAVVIETSISSVR